MTRVVVKLFVLVSILPIGLLIALTPTAASAQAGVDQQIWEYAVMTWNVPEDVFTWSESRLYGAVESINAKNDLTNELWESLDAGDAVLVDYLAAMGVSNFDLIAVTPLSNGLIVFYFKRLVGDLPTTSYSFES